VKRQIRVVGAAVLHDGLILCAQRGLNGNLAGLWEFPGGKIEPGESPEVALEREIREELDCSVEVGREITTTIYEYDFGIISLTTFYCSLISGTPTLTEHVALKWMSPGELDTITWAPADIPAVVLIQADHA
jgi:8-oxo-dGTP diphosphatase